LAAVLQATIPISGMFLAHVMLHDEPLQLPKLLGVLLALGGVTLICGGCSASIARLLSGAAWQL